MNEILAIVMFAFYSERMPASNINEVTSPSEAI